MSYPGRLRDWGWGVRREVIYLYKDLSFSQMWVSSTPSELPQFRVVRHRKLVGPTMETGSRCDTDVGSHFPAALCDFAPLS